MRRTDTSLDRDLADLVTGAAHGVLILGAARSGKTALAQRALQRAAHTGHPGAYVWASPALNAAPLAALAGVLRPDVLGADVLRSSPPPILCVDDAHWLDEASTGVVQAALTHGLVRLILTYRADDPVVWEHDAEWAPFPLRRIVLNDGAAATPGAATPGAPARAASGPGLRLTPREQDVLELLAAGLTAATIGRRLGISEHTVVKHRQNLYRKLGTGNRVSAVLRAQQLGLVRR